MHSKALSSKIMLIEQGVHVLSDGTAMVADKIVTDHDWAQAEFIL